jgi:hypothetical protein
MIRSGSALQYNITRQVVSSVPGNRTVHVNENIRNIIQSWYKRPEFVVNKGHFVYYYESRHVKYIKLLLTYRDIRDIVVSTMKFRKASFEEVAATIYAETIAREQKWLEFIPPEQVRRVRYADMYIDIAVEALAIADFLGIPLSNEKAAEIAENLSIERMRPILATMNNMDAFTQYSPTQIQGVVPRQWETQLTPEQVNTIMSDSRIADWMQENGYL